jgi:predicted RND superfamily exporter protein
MISFKNIIQSSLNHAKIVITVTFAVTALMLYFTLQIGFNPDVNSLLPEDNPSNTNFLDLNSNGEFTDNFSFLVRGDDLYTPEHLQQLYLAVEQIEAFDNITTGIHAFSYKK